MINNLTITDNFEISCPKCKASFSIKDFKESKEASSNFTSFFNKLYDDKILEIKSEIQKDAFNKYKLEFDEKITNAKTVLEANNKASLAQKEKELNDKYTTELTKKDREIIQMQNKIANFDVEKQNIKTSLENEIRKSFTEEIKKINEDNKKAIFKNNEDNKLETAKLNKKIEDLVKQNSDLIIASNKNKIIKSGIAGANLETEIKEILAERFPRDEVRKINNSGKKADIIQSVRMDGLNNIVGSIAYEVKDTKDWDDKWEEKFASDIKSINANYGIIVAVPFSQEYNKSNIFAISKTYSNMYFTSPDNVDVVAHILRFFIFCEMQVKQTAKNSSEAEIRFNKINSWYNKEFKELFEIANKHILKLTKTYENINKEMEPFKSNIDSIKTNFIEKIEIQLQKLINNMD